MKKKIVSLLLTSAMFASLLAGCGTKEAKEEANGDNEGQVQDEVDEETQDENQEEAEGKYRDVTINFWSMWNSTEPQATAIQAAADAFSEKTGATINIEWKGRDLNTIIMTSLEAEEDIDIFEQDYSGIAKLYKDYVLDLTDMAEAADYAANSYACFNDTVTNWAGFLPCVTEQPQVGGIFYNKDIFEDCGITEVPTTWAELLEACRIMKDKGYEPMALDSAYTYFWAGYHLARHLGEDKVSELTLNGGWSDNADAVTAAQEIIDFVNAGYLADGAPDEYPAGENKMGLTGKVAMIVCANYVCSEVNNNTGVELNWGMFNYPAVANGADPNNSFAGATSLAITKYSENAQAAFDFITFMTSGENDQLMADTATQIPADPSNTAPAIMEGTIETLQATDTPLSWGMGLGSNIDINTEIIEWTVQLFDGTYASGQEAMEALDSIY